MHLTMPVCVAKSHVTIKWIVRINQNVFLSNAILMKSTSSSWTFCFSLYQGSVGPAGIIGELGLIGQRVSI